MYGYDRYLSFDGKLKVALIAYSAVALAKLACYFLTGFLVMLAEFFHNIIDITIFLTLLYTHKLAKKPPDLTHPFGHGLAQNVGCVVVSIVFITVVALELFKEGFERIINPQVGRFPEVAIAVLIASLLIPLILMFVFKRERIAERSAFAELQNDVMSNIGAIVGVQFSSIGYYFADGLLTVFIALLICRNGYRIFKENVSYLLGKSPDKMFYRRVREITMLFPEVLDVHDIVAVYVGEDSLHVDMHITVRGDMTVREADELTRRIARKLMKEIPEIKYILIHVCAERGRFIRTTANSVMENL